MPAADPQSESDVTPATAGGTSSAPRVPTVEVASDASLPLTLCPSGCRATIHLDELDASDRAMLEAMGMEHGGEVEICQVGSPCILRVESTRVGVCREVAGRLRATVSATVGGRTIAPRA
jgi:Fe2+ transport system protein FeoA